MVEAALCTHLVHLVVLIRLLEQFSKFVKLSGFPSEQLGIFSFFLMKGLFCTICTRTCLSLCLKLLSWKLWSVPDLNFQRILYLWVHGLR